MSTQNHVADHLLLNLPLPPCAFPVGSHSAASYRAVFSLQTVSAQVGPVHITYCRSLSWELFSPDSSFTQTLQRAPGAGGDSEAFKWALFWNHFSRRPVLLPVKSMPFTDEES